MPRHVAHRPMAATGAGAPTQTITDAAPRGIGGRHIGTLRLRGEPRPRHGVRWAADVVDNSNMGKKKSKVCCIYHKPHAVGESSSESDSSSSSSDADSDSEPDDSKARMGGKGAAKRRAKAEKRHEADHGSDCEHHHGRGEDDTPDSSASDDDDAGPGEADRPRARRGHVRRPSPNAYEKMKTYKTRKGGSGTVTITENPGR